MVVRYRFRLYVLTLGVFFAFGLLLWRLWGIQVDGQDEYSKLVPGTSTFSLRVPGVRGEIKDRNGITLASNRATYQVTLNLKDIEKAFRKKNTEVPRIEYKVRGSGGIRRVRKESDIVEIAKSEVIRPLEHLGLAADFKASKMQNHYRSRGETVPYVYRRDLTFDEFATFAEHNLGLPGVEVSVRPMRKYDLGAFGSHLLGYVRLADDDNIPAEEKGQYRHYIGDDYGVAGIEKTMDAQLRGRPGRRTFLKDEKGVLKGEIDFEEPRTGSDVYMTIDARIQMIAERAFRAGGIGRGAAVVMDPSNGEILAMVSVPSYDANNFIPTISQENWNRYNKDETVPLINRAISSYAPGSTYKIAIALAGCMSGKSGTAYHCAGGVSYGRTYLPCWQRSGHGTLRMSDSLRSSCNPYYYRLGTAIGIKQIRLMGEFLGLTDKTGVRLTGESPGLMPDPEYMRATYPRERWAPARTALVSIGQWDTLASPLQIASMTSTVANGGRCYRPRLISRVVDEGDDETPYPTELRYDLLKEGLTKEQIETVRYGMFKVVNSGGGTGKRAAIPGVKVAGKTGTAQFGKVVNGKTTDNHAWFTGFAPYDDPRFSICVLVRGGKAGGSVAGPVAKRILEQSLALDKGFLVDIKPLKEAVGSFSFIESVYYGKDPIEVAEADDDSNVPVIVPLPNKRKTETVRKAKPVAPIIKPTADAQGRLEPSPEPPASKIKWRKRDKKNFGP